MAEQEELITKTVSNKEIVIDLERIEITTNSKGTNYSFKLLNKDITSLEFKNTILQYKKWCDENISNKPSLEAKNEC